MDKVRNVFEKCVADVTKNYEEYVKYGIMFMVRKDLVWTVKTALTLAGSVEPAKEISKKVAKLASWKEDTGVVNDEGYDMVLMSFPSGLNAEDILNVISTVAGISDAVIEHRGPKSFAQIHVA